MKKLMVLVMILLAAFAANAVDLMIFGGESHEVFLGFLNRNQFDSKSIWNEFGTYGNEFNSNSIWNEFGKYGSEFSQYSPFNEYASYPPVIVDRDGNFYGYFTVNEFKSKRCELKLVLIIYKCYGMIREDVTKWADKLNL